MQKEIKDKLEEAMAQLITQPSSLELQGLVEKGIVSIFDYQMQSMNTDEMTGGYFGKMMNAIYAANTFPLFDDISAGLVQSIAQAKLIDISKLDGEVLRHAGVESIILMTLPTLES